MLMKPVFERNYNAIYNEFWLQIPGRRRGAASIRQAEPLTTVLTRKTTKPAQENTIDLEQSGDFIYFEYYLTYLVSGRGAAPMLQSAC